MIAFKGKPQTACFDPHVIVVIKFLALLMNSDI